MSTPSGPPPLPWPGTLVTVEKESLVSLGHLVKPHGHRGAIKLHPAFDDPTALRQLPKPVILVAPLDKRMKPATFLEMHLAEFFPHQKFIVLQIKEIHDMDVADRFRGAEVFVREDNLWPLPPGEFFAYQLAGFDVYDLVTNRSVGKLKDIHSLSAHELLEVEKPDGKAFYVPKVPEIYDKTDAEKQIVYIRMPQGLDEV